ncbi:MAG: hypothetical protein PUD34_01370 [bacterium]|nr:hypothetical protein [bacterium]
MDNRETLDTLKRIDIETLIWIVYIFLVCFNLYSNYLEKLYVKTHQKFYKNKFRQINKIVLSVILIIYVYYVYLAFKDETALTRYKNPSKKKKFYTDLIFLAAILFLIAGAISLYVATKSDDIDEEIPLI